MNHTHGPEEATFYGKFISPGDLCFDIGANHGEKTSLFLGLGAKVIAVEPQENCIQILRSKFGHDPNCVIVEKALAQHEGEGLLYVNDFDFLSTLSTEWMQRMQASGRFQGALWRRQVPISLTTLDKLVETHGIPSFCKIDVEGHEWHVLQGLTRPIPAISIEFAEETIRNSYRCIHYLQGLGSYEFNYCKGVNTYFELDEWVDAQTACKSLGQLTDYLSWGDVYARLIP